MAKIMLNDLLHFDAAEVPNVRVKFNISNGYDDPLDLYKTNPDEVNVTWFLWHDDRRYFNVGQTAICLLKLRGDQWLLTTIKKITRLLDVTDGVGYDAVEVKEYEQYFGRLVVEYHNPCRTMGRKYENVMDELEVVQILNEQYTGNEFPGYENVRLSYPLLKNIVDRQLPGWVDALRNQKAVYLITDTKTGELRSIKDHCGRPDTQMCVFEFIYFARPDSVIEGSSVHEARKQAGRFLAQEHPVEADVVIGVPDSGLDAALGYSQESGIPYGIGFIKNKYIGRTFIQGSQKQRENSVRIKLNVVSSTVKGKRVVLVDDSIVRGTTSARIIKLLRDAGAAEVHFMVSAPPFKYPCYFGTDIPDQKLLVATGRTLEQINEVIGADTLGYLSNEHVVQLAKNAKCGFCTACFTGEYAVEPESVLSTDIHDRHLNDRPKDAKKLGE